MIQKSMQYNYSTIQY